MTPLKSPFCLMTTSTLLPISTLMTMSQEQIEDLSPQEYSLFLSDGEIVTKHRNRSIEQVVLMGEIRAHITWV